MKRVLSLGDITNVTADDNTLNDDNGVFTQVRGRRKKSKKTGTVLVQSNGNILIDDRLHNMASQSSPSSTPDASCVAAPSQQDIVVNQSTFTSEMTLLRKTVEDLTSTVQSYKLIIDKLSNQLNFVLGYLDISSSKSVNSPITMSTSSAADETAVTVTAAATSYASIAATVPASGVSSRPASLREAVVTAVSVDRRDKERRAKTVVVSGLEQRDNSTDADSFRRLSMMELGIDPHVKFTRRLGVAVGDRVQPLLVGLQSADQATDLIQRATQLRRSTDELVRRRVYINRNLTATEARLAYEDRCRRRRRRRRSSQHQAGHQQSTLNPMTPSFIPLDVNTAE